MSTLLVKKVVDHAVIPTRNNPTDAGIDLYSTMDVELKPGIPTKIPTGIAMAIPDGHVGLICDRSGYGSKGIKAFGGVIDSGYRGEVQVVLANLATFEREWFKLPAGSKIAQMLIIPIALPTPQLVDDLDITERGDKGFGSSGN